MATKRGAGAPGRCERLKLSTSTKRRLWSESGGYCQRPDCAEFLFADDDVDFAEMAHIVAATTGGARDISKQLMSEEERAHHSNIAVLCANCHTTVDKNPDRYPIALIHEWKTRHREVLAQGFGTPNFTTRAAARDYVEPLLAENRLVFSTYGPLDDDYSAERAQRWQHHAVGRVVPNNVRVARVLRANRSLLSPAERLVADRFDLHQNEFAARHVLHDYSAGTTTFPEGLDDILKGDA